jgi:hypothetical protein
MAGPGAVLSIYSVLIPVETILRLVLVQGIVRLREKCKFKESMGD